MILPLFHGIRPIGKFRGIRTIGVSYPAYIIFFDQQTASNMFRPLPILLFFVCFLLLFWAEHCFKETFLLVTSAHFGWICSHFCSLKCANYSYFCFARSIPARFVVSARYVLQIPPSLLYVQRLWPWFSQRLQLHGSCAGCLGAIVHIYTRHIYILFFACMIL